MQQSFGLKCGLFAVLFGLSSPSLIAQEFPARPITVVVPYAAGGVTDQITRIVSDSASQILGQTIIVENRGGAGGQIAANAVKNAAPDGYTLMLADIGTHAINQTLFAKLSYDPLGDFVPVAEIGESPQVLVVPADSPFKSIADIIKAAKENPKSLKFASPGIGSGSHLQGEILAATQKIELVHVPYRGSSGILPDLTAGRIDFFFGAASSTIGFVNDGKLRLIAVADPKRISAAPQIPTVIEAGAPELSLPLWVGILAPAKTPADIVTKLHSTFVAALASPKVRERFASNIINAPPRSTAIEFGRFMKSETERLEPIIKQAGIKLD